MKPLYLSHTVTSTAETWGKVAEWYTGTWKNWQRIREYNPDLHGKRLAIGDIILIPMEMVKNESPLVIKAPPKVRSRPKPPAAKKTPDNGEFVLPPQVRTIETPETPPTPTFTATPTPQPTEVVPAPVIEPTVVAPTPAAPTPEPVQPQTGGGAAGSDPEMEALLEKERKALEKLQMEVLGGQKAN
jgi:hypothetical protein